MIVEKPKSIHKSKSEQAADKNVVRVYLNSRDEGTFICPACNNGVIKNLGKFIQAESAIRIKCKCKCGHIYPVLVERRRYFRKYVNLHGTFIYQNVKGKVQKGLIRVLDISQTGIQFSVNSVPEFKVGDRLHVEFKLDDEDGSLIREEGTVERIWSNKVGMQFDNAERYGKLGNYLFQ